MKISGSVPEVVAEAEFAPCVEALAPLVDPDGFDVAWLRVVDVDVAFVDVLSK